jgi:predicted ribosome quality control (RQC) complex YloA/Tae2 family protein
VDNLVLIRVVATLDRSLAGALLQDVKAEPAGRLRLIFVRDGRPLSAVIALDARRPWLGRAPRRRGRDVQERVDPFAAQLRRSLGGRRLEALTKPPADRRCSAAFAGDWRLEIELVGARPNAVLVDAEGRVVASARRPPSDARRLAGAQPYLPPPPPAGRLDPFGAAADEIEVRLARADGASDEAPRAIQRALLGIGREGALLAWSEALARGVGVGQVLVERLTALLAGTAEPVVEAPGPPLELAERGQLEPARCRLLPWAPDAPPADGRQRFTGCDAAETAGLYHEAVDLAEGVTGRAQGLREILEERIRRSRRAEAAVEADLARFADPERYRRWGEALLAGMSRAQRSGELILVPDPCDPGAPPIAVDRPRPPRPASSDAGGLAEGSSKAAHACGSSRIGANGSSGCARAPPSCRVPTAWPRSSVRCRPRASPWASTAGPPRARRGPRRASGRGWRGSASSRRGTATGP